MLRLFLTIFLLITGISRGYTQEVENSADILSPGKIAFASNRDGDYEIYVMDADGNNVQQLTDNQFNDVDPAWSPDGSQILFVSDRDGITTSYRIYVMSFDGTKQTRLGFSESQEWFPTWSPDGTQIAYSVEEANDETTGINIYVMNVDGSDNTRITTAQNFNEYFVSSWSPDGTHLLLSSDFAFEPDLKVYGTNYAFYRVNVDGTHMESIGLPGGKEFYPPSPKYSSDGSKIVYHANDATVYIGSADGSEVYFRRVGYYPAWSPDDKKIVFTRRQLISEGIYSNDMDIYVMNLDGSNLVQLTDTPGFDNQYPSWQAKSIDNSMSINEKTNSTDSHYALVYIWETALPSADLYRIDLETFEITAITNVIASLQRRFVEQASCAPAGDQILFTTGNLHAVDPDGDNLETILLESIYSVAYSPDGTKIAFDGVVGNLRERNIFVVDVDGKNIRQVTDSPVLNLDPTWSPDGQQIAFVQTNSKGEFYNIVIMNQDGSSLHQIYSAGSWIGNVSWSPINSDILFFQNDGSDSNIYVINSDGDDLRQLTSDAGINVYAEWSPDGQSIGFSSNRDTEAFELYVMDADATNIRRITNDDYGNDKYMQCWLVVEGTDE